MRASPNSPIRDGACAGALALVAVLYLTSLPHNLGAVDEANFIYEAQRLAQGEVMYRDVFDLITPLSLYATAFALRVFGHDMGVARATIAVVHAIIVVAIFACARRLGVRALLASAAALAHLALAYPTWPYVSQHWFATAANTVVLLALLRCPWAERPLSAAVPGALTGILIGIQQQKGAPIAVGAGMIFILAHLILRRAAVRQPLRVLGVQLVAFTLGVIGIVVPLLAYLVWAAGVGPVVEALVVFPLVNYRGAYRSAWGGMQLFTAYYASFTFPTLLKFAPMSAVPLVVRVATGVARRHDPKAVLPLLTLLIFTAVTTASIAYYPDIIHLAFIAPVYLVVTAEVLEWAARGLRAERAVAAAVVALCCIGATIWQLRGHRQRLWTMFPIPYETAFGRMDFNDRGLIPVIDKVRELLAAAPVKEMFCYPSIAGPYLWTGAKNSTRYQFFSPTYNDSEQAREIINRLEERQTPFIMTSPLSARKDDPIVQYLMAHYELVRFGYLPKFWLYVRKSPGDQDEPPAL